MRPARPGRRARPARPVSPVRSAVTSAVAGTTIVGAVLLLAMVLSARGGDVWSATIRVGGTTTGWQVPVLIAVLTVGPPVLATAFGAFFLIGRRAARPIEAARRQQLRFTADASHELRTPLTVIEGEASLALGRQRAPAEYREALEKVAAESRHMRRLVDDLLWLARSESDPAPPGLVPVDLQAVTEGAVERFQGVATEKRLRLTAAPAAGPRPVVWAPAEWMERLLGVLLDNGCRYTPAGGAVRAGAETAGDAVSLTVEDSGPGIPEGERERIFDRFRRATQVTGGSGLGLAIASRVVSETGGAWTVGQSELGGARLEVRWRRRDAAPDRQRRGVREPSRSGS